MFKFESKYDNYYDDLLELNPSFRSFMGDKTADGIFVNTLSDDYITKSKDLDRTYMNKFCSDNIYDKCIKYSLEHSISKDKLEWRYFSLDQLDNPFQAILEEVHGTSVYSVETVRDLENLYQRLTGWQSYLANLIEWLDKGIETKMTIPRSIAEITLSQCEEIYSEVNSHISRFRSKHLNKAPVEKIVEKVRDILSEYNSRMFIPFLKVRYIPNARESIGLCGLEGGNIRYDLLVKGHTTSNLDPEHIHDLGVTEVKRIFSEMKKIAKTNGHSDIPKFNRFLESRDKYVSPTEVLDRYRAVSKQIRTKILPEFFEHSDVEPYVIAEVPEFKAKHSPAAYYILPSLNKTRKGKFYLNVHGFSKMSKNREETLTRHEGEPGHHYQLSIVLNNPNLHKLIKYNHFTAYIEGWALYAEGLGEFRDDLSKYGRLQDEMMRACRLVIDTGIHRFGWTREKSVGYMCSKTGMDSAEALVEINRYISNPGQALAYKIGELTFLKLRDKSKLPIKEFHDKVLKHGALPLMVLEENFHLL